MGIVEVCHPTRHPPTATSRGTSTFPVIFDQFIGVSGIGNAIGTTILPNVAVITVFEGKINDSIALAKRLKADGVHLGQGDGDVREAREELGREAQIGVTCHASRHLALEAGEAGADYVAFGAFYPSETKETEHRAELDLLEWWHEMVEIPSVAIGGITPANCGPLVKAGADFLAVSGAVWSGDEVAVVKAFVEQIAKA